MELKDKVIVITGASSGIGEALALALAPRGPRLVLSGRDGAKLDEMTAHARSAVPGPFRTLPTYQIHPTANRSSTARSWSSAASTCW